MANSTANNDNGKGRLKIEPPGALRDIGYNSIIAAEPGTSSEDEVQEEQDIAADDARTAIGVSIGQEQTRLTSPKTPAVEKSAAIEQAGGFFGPFDRADGIPEETSEDEAEDEEITQRRSSRDGALPVEQAKPSESRETERPEIPLPSPWRVASRADWRTTGRERQSLLGGLFTRRRATSGPDPPSAGWQSSLLSSLPSLPSVPKRFSMNSPFSGSSVSQKESEPESGYRLQGTQSQSLNLQLAATSDKSSILGRERATTESRVREPLQRVSFHDVGGVTPSRDGHGRRISPSAPPRANILRRSTSDQSLTTLRTVSTVESLGDDSRFEEVNDQVNSRLKAIRDSWQDASIKLPNFNVSQFTPDFFRDRSASLNKKRETASVSTSGRESSVSKHAHPIDPMTRQPYSSAKIAYRDAASHKPSSHPHFNRALENLEGDIVVLGGYRGSILRSAEPPHRQVWVPVKVGLNLRKVNLEVGLDENADERASQNIIPGGMLTHIGPVDIARRLFKRLRSCENARSGRLRVHDYGYDWRLSPSYLSMQLIRFLENLPCNRPGVPKEKRGATIVAHSLGGLITRHAVNKRPELFKGVVYAGVPNTCVNILGPLRNGDDVLLSNRVLTAQVNFTIRTSFVLLPLDGRCFFNKDTKEEYPVDFFDARTWIDYRLSPCVARPLPPFDQQTKPAGISGYVSSLTNALPSLPLPGRKGSALSKSKLDPSQATTVGGAAEPDTLATKPEASRIDDDDDSASNSISTAVSISREKAIEYLERTLASVKQFKQELEFEPVHAESNSYPPVAVIYGKSTPTVFGAKVSSRDSIKHSDAYDNLAFASGDGVVLARAAMLPKGYTAARGGTVASDRGHVTLLGDLEAVGKCLNAVMNERKKGVGYGNEGSKG